MDAVPRERAAALPDEPALLALARTGDEEAFRKLVVAYQDRVYGLALRIVRSPQDAEDVAQEAFLRAWCGLPGFRGEASFSTWLCSIAVRRAVDRATMLKARREREAGVDAAEELPAPAGPGEAEMHRSRRLRVLVEKLSPIQRAVVTLYYTEGRSTREVAAMLLAPEGTIKTHLSRARAALREGWLRQEGSR